MTNAPLIYELLERHSQGTERITDPVAQLAEQLTLNQGFYRQSLTLFVHQKGVSYFSSTIFLV